MVAPSCLLGRGDSEAMPPPPSPQRTHASNTTTHPGLPDKPEPRCTSEQKRADEKEVRRTEDVKEKVLQDSYYQISALQEKMVEKQVVALTSNHAPVHPKPHPRVLQKGQGTKNLMPPRDPFIGLENKSKEHDVHKLLVSICHERLREAKANSTSINTEVKDGSQATGMQMTTDDDSDELQFTSQFSKGCGRVHSKLLVNDTKASRLTNSLTLEATVA
ncbi:hypothetical protein JVU11DRAFT_10772 [Chiua virens]|nr:hypothetical protein JVU11DRAFT_10772 [Chiua virens]